jgi:ATP-dependent DNA helicase Q1
MASIVAQDEENNRTVFLVSIQNRGMEDEENIEGELLLVESQLHDIQGIITTNYNNSITWIFPWQLSSSFRTSHVHIWTSCFTGQIKTLLDRQEELYERQAQLKALLEASKLTRNTTINTSSVAPEDWSGSFPWDLEADDTRFNIFGISSYRSNQREVSL